MSKNIFPAVKQVGHLKTYHSPQNTYISIAGYELVAPEYTAIDWPDGTVLHVTGTDAEMWIKGQWKQLPQVRDTHAEIVAFWLDFCERELPGQLHKRIPAKAA